MVKNRRTYLTNAFSPLLPFMHNSLLLSHDSKGCSPSSAKFTEKIRRCKLGMVTQLVVVPSTSSFTDAGNLNNSLLACWFKACTLHGHISRKPPQRRLLQTLGQSHASIFSFVDKTQYMSKSSRIVIGHGMHTYTRTYISLEQLLDIMISSSRDY